MWLLLILSFLFQGSTLTGPIKIVGPSAFPASAPPVGISFGTACGANETSGLIPDKIACSAISVTANQTVIVSCTNTTGQTSTVTDSESTSWSGTPDATYSNSTIPGLTQIFSAKVAGSSASYIPTCTSSGNFGFEEIVVETFSGLTPTFDKTAQTLNQVTAAPASGNTSTTSTANEVLIGAVTASNLSGHTPITAGGSFTFPAAAYSGNTVAMEYEIVSSTGAYSSSFNLTGSAAWSSAIATYY